MTILKRVEVALSEEGKVIFTSAEIKELMSVKFGINPNSVLPSDYCYNRTNNGIDKSGLLVNKFLIRNADKTYCYVGFGYDFSGYVYQKPQGSKKEIIVGYWTEGNYYPVLLPQNDIGDLSGNSYFEGAVNKITVNSFERNPKARKECIDFHGCQCWVCGFDFETVCGELGKDFIHVHHIIPLSEVRKEYKVNPREHLLPLCPNCHAMVHRYNPAMDPTKLKHLLAEINA